MDLAEVCTPETFPLSLPEASILSIETTPVTDYTVSVPATFLYTQPPISAANVSFCNVTVSYTHPGHNETIFVETWLPAEWNERLQAVGGSGSAAGRCSGSYMRMDGAVADGYATVTTDAGLGGEVDDASSWALDSKGNVNMHNLENLASLSLYEEAIIAKSLIESFYGQPPSFSYWNGCSQGGRQGLMLAQRYPEAYDGIAAGAPAIYWTELLPSTQWPQQIMNMAGVPYGCEVDAIVEGARSECDGLDGVVDGIIADVDTCLGLFDPFGMVGLSVKNCPDAGGSIEVSKAAATVVNATLHGMQTEDGRATWYGIPPGADLTGELPLQPGVVSINCTAGTCVGQPSNFGLQWLQLFVARDPELDVMNLTHAEFDELVGRSGEMYRSVVGTEDPDLTKFRDAGGKMVTFHGLADNIIPPKNTEHYYNAVSALIPDTQDFYRYFEVPGLGHCMAGASGQPESLFEQLRAWVENGTAPEETPVRLTDLEGEEQDRILCPYPKRAEFDEGCGKPGDAGCWSCENRGGPSAGLRVQEGPY